MKLLNISIRKIKKHDTENYSDNVADEKMLGEKIRIQQIPNPSPDKNDSDSHNKIMNKTSVEFQRQTVLGFFHRIFLLKF